MRHAVIAASLLLAPVAASAQNTGILQGWDSGQVTIYGWLPGITGAQELPNGRPIVDLDNADVLDALNFFFFGAGEIRRGRISLGFDIEYADLSQNGQAERTLIPNAEPPTGSVGTNLLMSTGILAYRVHETDRAFADIYAGVRAYDVELKFGFQSSTLGFDFNRTANANWVDGIVGVRGHVPIGGRFGVTGLADVGGFGIGDSSDLTWQATGTLDYNFTDTIAGRIGYRYMAIDYQGSSLGMDVDMYGPLLGVTWSF